MYTALYYIPSQNYMNLHFSPSMIRIVKIKKIREAGHVTLLLVGNTERKEQQIDQNIDE